jgi:hypothetical protein
MGIHRVKIPDEHRDIIKDLTGGDEGLEILVRMVSRELKRGNKEFWKAIKAAIPELMDVEEALHYLPDKHEVYWID